MQERPKPVQFRVVLDYKPQLKYVNYLGQWGDSGIGFDVEFVVKGEKIPAHTSILRGGVSPVLAAMFEHDMTESSSHCAFVDDIESHVFRQLLPYLYTKDEPKVEDGENMAEELFIAADKYQVNNLRNCCDFLLSKKISDDNVLRLLVLAHLHSAHWLKEGCIDFIIKNKASFFQSEESLDLSRNYPDLFSQLVAKSRVLV